MIWHILNPLKFSISILFMFNKSWSPSWAQPINSYNSLVYDLLQFTHMSTYFYVWLLSSLTLGMLLSFRGKLKFKKVEVTRPRSHSWYTAGFRFKSRSDSKACDFCAILPRFWKHSPWADFLPAFQQALMKCLLSARHHHRRGLCPHRVYSLTGFLWCLMACSCISRLTGPPTKVQMTVPLLQGHARDWQDRKEFQPLS